MAEAYCVKDKKKVEVQNAAADHDEERQAGDPGHLPGVRRQGLPDRRLTRSVPDATQGPRRTAGALPCPGRAGPVPTGPIRALGARGPFGTMAVDARSGSRGPCAARPIAASDLTRSVRVRRPARRAARPGGPAP